MRSFSSAERLVAAFDELVDAALALYKDERLFQAAEIVLVLRAGVAAFADADDRVGKLGARLDENENIVLIEDRSVLLKEMWTDMVQEDKWTLVKDSGSIKTSYHHVEGAPIHSLLLEGDVDASIDALIGVISEIDLWKLWFPQTSMSTELARLSLTSKLGQIALKFPWPVWNRDIVLLGYGADLLERGLVAIGASSIEEHPAIEMPEVPSKHVRMSIRVTGFLLHPLTPTKTSVKMLVNANPELAVIPYSVMNFVTHQIGYLAFKGLRATAEDPPKEYAEKRAAGPEVYDLIETRMAEYFAGWDADDPDAAAADMGRKAKKVANKAAKKEAKKARKAAKKTAKAQTVDAKESADVTASATEDGDATTIDEATATEAGDEGHWVVADGVWGGAVVRPQLNAVPDILDRVEW